MNPFFKNVNIFRAQNIHFTKENFEKLNILWNDYFRNVKFSIFYGDIDKSRELTNEVYDVFRHLSKNLSKIGLELFQNGWKFLKIMKKSDCNL